MTARHDPPGKILGDHGAGDIKYAARVESTVMSRKGDRRSGERVCLWRTVCQVDLSLFRCFSIRVLNIYRHPGDKKPIYNSRDCRI